MVLNIIHNPSVILHSIGVVTIARRLCKRMNVRWNVRLWVAVNALVHDVGKVLIPNSILNKNGPLTPAERDIIDTHTTNWVAKLFGRYFPAVTEHHIAAEREALDRMSFVSKMIRLCDIADACTGRFRWYTNRRDTSEVVELLEKNKSTLDKEMYDVCMKNINVIDIRLLDMLDSFVRAIMAQKTGE